MRLSDEQVKEIRDRRAAGEAQEDLAEEYDVAQSTVSMIVTGVRRTGAPGPIQVPRPYIRRRR